MATSKKSSVSDVAAEEKTKKKSNAKAV